ncbi:MAG: hypothetical protein IKZ08_02620 [Bacteroidales bacterium]|nr:hypothetical protein [Bacteroidales bacterium]
MSKLSLADIAKSIRATLSKHSPEILTGIGIAGMITTTVLAVGATPKAMALIDEYKQEEDLDELTPLETVKTCWKCYIPAVATGVVSTVCLIGASSVHTRRNAALATAYNLSQAALTEYKDAVVDTIGEKKERAVRERAATRAVSSNPVNEEDVIITGRGNTLCYDRVFGRYFRSSREVIERGMNAVNRQIVSGDMFASLNDFYDELELPHIDIGDVLGWNLDDGEITVDFDYDGSHNGEPTLVIHYNVVPKYDFYKFV